VAEDGCLQIAIGIGDSTAGTEEDVLKGAAVLGEGEFSVGAAIEVVEDCFGAAALGDTAKIFDVDDAW
jgi:hypothetical protein